MKSKSRMKFSVSKLVSLNKWQRWHWRKRQQFQDELNTEVYWLIHKHFTPGEIPQWNNIKLTCVIHSPKELDADNRMATIKIMADAVHYAELIPDDAPQYIEYGIPSWVKDKERYTEVEIEKA